MINVIKRYLVVSYLSRAVYIVKLVGVEISLWNSCNYHYRSPIMFIVAMLNSIIMIPVIWLEKRVRKWEISWERWFIGGLSYGLKIMVNTKLWSGRWRRYNKAQSLNVDSKRSRKLWNFYDEISRFYIYRKWKKLNIINIWRWAWSIWSMLSSNIIVIILDLFVVADITFTLFYS